MHRKATVRQIAALQQLGLEYNDGRGGIPVTRPFLGGAQAGFHYMPSVGDEVIVHNEQRDYPAAATSCTSNPAGLIVLQPGESRVGHSDGRYAIYLKSDGSVTVAATPAGASITIDSAGNVTITAASGGKVNVTATGGLWVNGTQVSVP